MKAGDLDVGFGRVRADHIGTKPCHRFAQQAAATADIEAAQPLECVRGLRVAAEMPADMVLDVAQPHRAELVQGLELARRVPPLFCHGGKARDFLAVDRASGFLSPASHRTVLSRA